jgi:pimeloyl-ACP methyl ester carboxylesterase
MTARTRVALAALAALALAAAIAGSARTAPTHACASGTDVRFRAADGAKLVGHPFGGKRPGGRTTVVLAHMSEGDICWWLPYARSLAGKGFFVFPFDFRGHGLSGGRQNHARAAADVVAAVRAVRSLGARKIVVVGASLGGIAALIAAPSIRPTLEGVVAVSAPARISGQLDALPAARRLSVPTLYVAAVDDQNAGYDFAADARALFDTTATAEKRLELVPGALHGTFLVSGSSRVRSLMLRFLRDPAATVP